MKNIFIALYILIGLTACETVIEIDIPTGKPFIVANSFFNADSSWSVELFYSRHILDDSFFRPVEDATVTILAPEGLEIPLAKDEEKPGLYVNTEQKPLINVEYTLQIQKDGYETVTSTSKLPVPVPIKRVEFENTTGLSDTNENLTAKVIFDDPAGQNFYELYVMALFDYYYVNFQDDTIHQYSYRKVYLETTDNTLVDNSWNNGSLIFRDILFNNSEAGINLKFSNYYYNNIDIKRLDFYLISQSREYYLYNETANLQDYNSGDPFAQPVQVYNNIQNGKGIFAGYSISVHSIDL